MKKHNSRCVFINKMGIGDNYPVRVESMLKVPLNRRDAILSEVKKLKEVGCELLRVAFPSLDLKQDLDYLVKEATIPIMADIHFDGNLALAAMESGCPSIRINPGNMKNKKALREIISMAKDKGVVIRIGVNGGSLASSFYEKAQGDEALALVLAVKEQINLMQDEEFEDLIISAKATSVKATLKANTLLRQLYPYPLHIGITEAGPGLHGIVKSSVGIALMLSQGIGDTIRVSLTASSVEEVKVGQEILQALGIRRFRVDLISCPTCGRKRVDVNMLVEAIEPALGKLPKDWTVAVMGCEVNGPKEASGADFGIAGTQSGVVFFQKGKVIGRCSVEEIASYVKSIIEGF